MANGDRLDTLIKIQIIGFSLKKLNFSFFWVEKNYLHWHKKPLFLKCRNINHTVSADFKNKIYTR
jgi:hypothetical protein